MERISWQHVLDCKARLGHISVMMELADKLEYKFFIWNDTLYQRLVDRWVETPFTREDIL